MAKAISGKEARVKRGVLEIECPDLNPRHAVPFGPTLRDFKGNETALRDDATYCPVVNPYDARGVWLYDDKGGFCGFAPARHAAAHPGDAQALTEHYKAKAVHFAPILAEARKLAAPITQRASDNQDHNAAVFASQAKEETKMDRELDRRARKSTEDFTSLGGEAPAAKTAGVPVADIKSL
jgi:hypothetical protein